MENAMKKFFVGSKPIPEPVEFRLTSTMMVNTPGLLAWGINGYKFKKDRKNILRIFTEGFPGPAPEAFDALLDGKLPYAVDEDNAVIFTGWKLAA
jgi:hypothetical protein